MEFNVSKCTIIHVGTVIGLIVSSTSYIEGSELTDALKRIWEFGYRLI